eukprot:1226904-Amphidinium_carterae.1
MWPKKDIEGESRKVRKRRMIDPHDESDAGNLHIPSNGVEAAVPPCRVFAQPRLAMEMVLNMASIVRWEGEASTSHNDCLQPCSRTYYHQITVHVLTEFPRASDIEHSNGH